MFRWMCGVSLKERQSTQNCEKYYRHRGNWGCDEKVQTEVALKCGMQRQ